MDGLQVCHDCALLLVNDDMSQFPDGGEAHLAKIDAHHKDDALFADHRFVLGDIKSECSSVMCDYCGTRDEGIRWGATAFAD